jgi:hypothetical protein
MSAVTVDNKPQAAASSWTENGSDAPYRTVSRAAVFSLILAIAGIASLFSPWMLVIPVCGVICGVVALSNIKRYPLELSGTGLAKTGLAISGLFLTVAPTYHGYVYLTEVPEGYERISFWTLSTKSYEPDYPTQDALSLNGKPIFIKGYIHPTSVSSSKAKKFILIPDLGTCCFGGQPRLTDMIEVTLTGNQTVKPSLRQIKLAGVLKVDTSLKPVKELQGVFYQLKADYLK